MFKRNRKPAPVIHMTRTNWLGQIIAVDFTDGIRASREQYGYWRNMDWDTDILPPAHFLMLNAL